MMARTHFNRDKGLLTLDLIYILKRTKNCPAQICVPIFSHRLPTVPLLLIENTVQIPCFHSAITFMWGMTVRNGRRPGRFAEAKGEI